jgi:hypothetical protein
MLNKKETYKTIVVITAGFMVLYFVFHSIYFLYIALSIALLSILSESLANFISNAWMKLAKVLSYIVPPITMSILFFFILTPIALLQKLFKKNKSFLLKNNMNSTFIASNKVFNKSSFEKPW